MYLYCDRDKSQVRDRHLITSIDGIWCYIKNLSGCQLRASSYKVKLSECSAVSPTMPTQPRSISPDIEDDEVSNPPFEALPPDALIKPPHFLDNKGSLPPPPRDDRTSPHWSPPVSAPSVAPQSLVSIGNHPFPTTNGNYPSTIQTPRLQMSQSDPNAHEGPLHTSKTVCCHRLLTVLVTAPM